MWVSVFATPRVGAGLQRSVRGYCGMRGVGGVAVARRDKFFRLLLSNSEVWTTLTYNSR